MIVYVVVETHAVFNNMGGDEGSRRRVRKAFRDKMFAEHYIEVHKPGNSMSTFEIEELEVI